MVFFQSVRVRAVGFSVLFITADRPVAYFKRMRVCIFITGGTFDKEYNELNGELFFKDTHMEELLKLGRCRIETTIEKLMLIDSLEMTDAQRSNIVTRCRDCAENKIVIAYSKI